MLTSQAQNKRINTQYLAQQPSLVLWSLCQCLWLHSFIQMCGIDCCCSVTKLYLTLCHPMDCSTQGCPVLHHLPEFAQTHVRWINDAILLMPSIFPNIKVFSNESALHIRWPNYWSFSFSISSSKKYSGVLSFRIDWFDLLAVQGDSQESSLAPQFKSINSSVLSLLYGPALTSMHDYWYWLYMCLTPVSSSPHQRSHESGQDQYN